LTSQQAAVGEVLLQDFTLLGDFAGAGPCAHNSVDLELQAAERPPVLQPAADHHQVADPQQLGDGRVAELLAKLLVVGSAKPRPQREDRAAARLGQGEGDAAAADRRRPDDLAAEPDAVGEGGRDRFPDALLKVGDAEGRLVGAVGGDKPRCW
jgi:hypothetical protein